MIVTEFFCAAITLEHGNLLTFKIHMMIDLLHPQNSTQEERLAAQGALFTLLLAREKELGFNPDVIAVCPEADFIDSPTHWLHHRLEAAGKDGVTIAEIVILTTYAAVRGPLEADGFHCEPVHMPAGPNHTAVFKKTLMSGVAGKTLYVEAVNEADPKIRPTFVFSLRDAAGELAGGVSGSIFEANGRAYAYIGTVVVREGLPAGTGGDLLERALAYLKARNVYEVNLGTQTAQPFYAKHGFETLQTVVPGLRCRTKADGTREALNLVMMSKVLE